MDDVLDELDWPSMEDCGVKSSLVFYCRIHSSAVSLGGDRYLAGTQLKKYQGIS